MGIHLHNTQYACISNSTINNSSDITSALFVALDLGRD